MSNFSLNVLILVTCAGFLRCESENVETKALMEIKMLLNDSYNFLGSWKEMESPCGFVGVKCNPVSGKVSEIYLENMFFSGVLSPSASELQGLTSLSLPTNYIVGPIPVQIANCTNLRVLNLTGNSFTGRVPDLSGMKNLRVLDLSGNYLSGEFPSCVGRLTGLVLLGLGDNDFDEGRIPVSLRNLKNLTWLYLGRLDLSRNNIAGNFPRAITKLRNIWKIELFKNNLTGGIPVELAELDLLQEFDVSDNKLSGELPPELINLKNLTVFHLFDNRFSGKLPASCGEVRYLKAFSVYRNNFTAPFPMNLGRYCNIRANIGVSW